MTQTKPVMVGYVVRPLTGSGTQTDQVEAQLRGFAERTGHELTRIFRDELHGRPCAVNAMITHVRCTQVTTVALVDGAALQAQHRTDLEAAGVQVLCAEPGP